MVRGKGTKARGGSGGDDPSADPAGSAPQILAQCRRCDLWRNATQPVPGEGPRKADLMFVGEQPGDEEDRRGHPFVGPAGRLLDQALKKAGIDRSEVFVTNAVKHFKWEARGKRRLHKKPNAAEINACHYWLVREIATVRPRLIVALGTTALGALVGPGTALKEARASALTTDGGIPVIATFHPSAVLRAPAELREEMMNDLLHDLRAAVRRLSRQQHDS